MQPNRRRFLKGASVAGLTTVSGLAFSGTTTAASYTIDSDLRQTVGISGSQLDSAVDSVSPGSPLVGLGDTWVDVQNNRNINAVYMAAHAALESAWGRSNIAQEKNNIYGFNARDICPAECADGYASFEQCVRQVMAYVDEEYLSTDGTYYEGSTLRGMNVHYASDDQWAEKIADIMNDIAAELPSGGGGDGGSGGFADGDQVAPTTALHTRKQPGTDQTVVATISAGEVGEIMNGPIDKDGYTWWGVHWLDRGVWGWSVERYLTSTSGGGSKPSVTFDQAASGNYAAANRTASDINWIIIHTIQGSYEGGISVFNNPDSGVSAHYVVGNSSGQITQMVYDDDISYAAGNYDYNSAGLNFENEGYASESHPDQLYQNLASIVSWACEEYGIPKSHPTGVAPADPADGSGIIGHEQVPDPDNPSVGGGASHHTDPGSGWEWDYFMSLL